MSVKFNLKCPPEKFDSLIGELNKIGTLGSIEINKIDKTNEYKDLKATRASLEKARASLENLRKLKWLPAYLFQSGRDAQ